MSGILAVVAALLAFGVPIAIPLFAQRWQTLTIVAAAGISFFVMVNFDLDNPAGISQAFGPFLFGLMLFGFAAGVIAKFVMLVGRR